MSARLRPLAVTGVLVLALTACGGGEERLTKAEFIKQADEICTADDDEIGEIAQDLNDDSSDEQIQEAVDAYVAIVRKQVEKLDDLEPPEALEQDVEEMLESLDQGLGEMEEKGAAMVRERTNPLEEAAAKAQALGLQECGT